MSLFKHLSRYTDSTKFIPEIDGLRFFAIITVVIMHTNTSIFRHFPMMVNILEDSLYLRIINKGQLGVLVFFSISGFILSLPFLKHYQYEGKNISLKRYFLRRLTRLEPPYLLSLTLFFVGLLLAGNISLDEGLPHYIASFFYAHNFIYGEWSIINPVTWSLETEVQFYILMPVIANLFFPLKGNIRRLLLLLVVLFGAFKFGFEYKELKAAHLNKSIIVYACHFFTGILFADIFLQYQKYFKEKHRLWDLIGIGAFILLFVMFNETSWSALAINILVFMIMIAIFKGPCLNRFHRAEPIVVIGGMCYTIYLLHYGFIHTFMLFTKRLNLGNWILDYIFQFSTALFFLGLVSVIFFKMVEQPSMKPNWYKFSQKDKT